jgi:hypothetical protein
MDDKIYVLIPYQIKVMIIVSKKQKRDAVAGSVTGNVCYLPASLPVFCVVGYFAKTSVYHA